MLVTYIAQQQAQQHWVKFVDDADGLNFDQCKGIGMSEFRKFLSVESGILGFGIRKIRNSISAEKEYRIQYVESGIHGLESRIQDCTEFSYKRRVIAVILTALHFVKSYHK